MKLNGMSIERTIGDERPSIAVVSAVADVTGTDPSELDPLYETIDPDALNSLFRGSQGDGPNSRGQVSFSVAGCDVVVHGSHKVVVSPTESTRE